MEKNIHHGGTETRRKIGSSGRRVVGSSGHLKGKGLPLMALITLIAQAQQQD